MGNLTKKISVNKDFAKDNSVKDNSVKVSFKKVSKKDHEKFRIPVYAYMIP